jgi:hypothetical protein
MWQDHLFSLPRNFHTVHREALTCFSPLPGVFGRVFGWSSCRSRFRNSMHVRNSPPHLHCCSAPKSMRDARPAQNDRVSCSVMWVSSWTFRFHVTGRLRKNQVMFQRLTLFLIFSTFLLFTDFLHCSPLPKICRSGWRTT